VRQNQELKTQNHYVKSIETNGVSKDAFAFFVDSLGDFNHMKSPQGRIAYVMHYPANFYFQFPLEDAFDVHTAVFSDDAATKINFTLA